MKNSDSDRQLFGGCIVEADFTEPSDDMIDKAKAFFYDLLTEISGIYLKSEGGWMKGKVLVVDDDPVMIENIRIRLSRAGYEVEAGVNGREALQKLNFFDPDIILADVMMPHMDGYELHSKLRKNRDTASIPFIFLSARSKTSDQLEGLRMGADDYVCKPFEEEDLIRRMERVLSRTEKIKQYWERLDFSGNLSQMTWADIIQIAELNYKTGELVFRNSEKKIMGVVFFYEGQLINARVGALEGEEALFTLMAEERGFFDFFGKKTETPRLIIDSNTAILLQGSRMADEFKSFRRVFPNLDVHFKKVQTQIPSEVEDKAGGSRLRYFLSLVDKGLSAQEIIYSKEMSPVRAASILSILLENKIIKPIGFDLAINAAAQPERFFPMIEKDFVKILNKIQQQGLTGVLNFEKRRENQAIFFKEGKLFHSYHGRTSGKKALFRIIRERGGRSKFLKGPASTDATISTPLTELLQEANREIMDLEKIEKDFFTQQVFIESEIDEEIASGENNQELSQIISLIKQHDKVADVINFSELTDGNTIEQLRRLIDLNVVRLKEKKGEWSTRPN